MGILDCVVEEMDQRFDKGTLRHILQLIEEVLGREEGKDDLQMAEETTNGEDMQNHA